MRCSQWFVRALSSVCLKISDQILIWQDVGVTLPGKEVRFRISAHVIDVQALHLDGAQSLGMGTLRAAYRIFVGQMLRNYEVIVTMKDADAESSEKDTDSETHPTHYSNPRSKIYTKHRSQCRKPKRECVVSRPFVDPSYTRQGLCFLR